MLYELTREISDHIKARRIAVDCEYGRWSDTPIIPDQPRIRIVESDDGDSFVEPSQVRGVQSTSWACLEGVTVLIQAASSKEGAGDHDHRRALKLLRNAFLVALLAKAHRRGCPVKNVRGAFVPIEGDALREYGARYALFFELGQAVLEDAAQLAAEGLIPSLTVKAHTPDVDEVACGPDA